MKKTNNFTIKKELKIYLTKMKKKSLMKISIKTIFSDILRRMKTKKNQILFSIEENLIMIKLRLPYLD